MTGTVITDLRRRGAVDPGRVLTGPLRAVGLQWLDPGRSTEVASDGIEHALYITAGSGTASVPDPDADPDAAEPGDPAGQEESADGIPLLEGTALTLPLGTRTVLTAGTAGLEYFHAILAVRSTPQNRPAAQHPSTPQTPEEGDSR
ncbi:hypothetical protein ACIGZJ_05510 [Kitasatospora sp. NPDC052868]|uniref:hypothetical protein n=1 Tax=Kitasatospora sp. NPDC052868 TaxID=3364060 RepID=UPI0037CB2341